MLYLAFMVGTVVGGAGLVGINAFLTFRGERRARARRAELVYDIHEDTTQRLYIPSNAALVRGGW